MQCGRLVVVGLFAILAGGLPAPAAAAGEKHNVLVLAGCDSLQPAYEQFMSGFRAGVNARAGTRLELFTGSSIPRVFRTPCSGCACASSFRTNMPPSESM
jgi:hypothetical protein